MQALDIQKPDFKNVSAELKSNQFINMLLMISDNTISLKMNLNFYII